MTLLPEKLRHFRHQLLIAMLGLLHLSLWFGIDSTWSRPFLLTHLGLFLLWQPLWRGEREVRPGAAVFIVCASAVALLWLNWWVLAFWVGGLLALVGGRAFSFRTYRQRLLHLSVISYLLAVLLLWVVPHLFAVETSTDTANLLMMSVLPLLLLAMLAMPQPTTEDQTENSGTVDFFYSMLLFMLLTLLVLGSLAFMAMEHVDYLESLLRTLFFIALVLIALAWLWNPRYGFSGLQAIFSRYLLNVGTPFEAWLKQLAETARQESSPSAFLERATRHLAELPWLAGLSWSATDSEGQLGTCTPHTLEIKEPGLSLTIFCKHAYSPAILLHIHLLTQLLSHFYQAKQREQSLREMAKLQAIYETGSRLTHDLKNMLQSLLALTSIAQQDKQTASPILSRQLPVLAQRIELTLSKLKAPQQDNEAAELPLSTWWENLRQRHQHEDIAWVTSSPPTDIIIPAAMFDCVTDNLIDNALGKRQHQPELTILVSLDGQSSELEVCDNGDAIPEHIARQLPQTVVQSESGLGVGLYQAARWATQLNYQLTLHRNQTGEVCFTLTRART